MCSKSKYQSLGYELHFVLQQKKIVTKVQSVTKLFIYMWKEHSHEGYLNVLPIDKFKMFLKKLHGKNNIMIQIIDLLPLLIYSLF
jgi:hypothetical protein